MARFHVIYIISFLPFLVFYTMFTQGDLFFRVTFVKNSSMQFKDIPGNEESWQKLRKAAENQRIAHAQLLIGPPGSGKLMVALAYAQYLNCLNPQGSGNTADSCGECASCRKFNTLEHPDLHFLFPVVKQDKKELSRDYMPEWREFVSNKAGIVNLNSWYNHIQVENKQGLIATDDIADILGRLQYKNHEAKIKTIIIWMAEKIQYNAAPKLLKTLEEPTDNTLFLLIAENHDMILPTILSRVQTTRLKSPTPQQIYGFLSQRFSDRPSSDIHDAIHNSSGNIEKAYDFLLNRDDLLLEATFFRDWMRTCFALKGKDIFSMASVFSGYGREKQKHLLAESARRFMTSLHVGAQVGQIRFYNPEDDKFFPKFASYINTENIHILQQLVDEAIMNIERNGNPRLIFSDLSFDIGRIFRKIAS